MNSELARRTILPFHTFLWKIASRCNLNCTYCYVYNSADSRWRDQPSLMSERAARQTAARIREHCEAHGKRSASIVFHGGEPLLGGLAHLEMLTTVIADTLGGTGLKLSVGIQSNGLLFDREIGDLMLARGMSIGVSLDGPPAINDLHRIDHRGRPTGARLEECLALLTSPRYRPIFSGFLCVINPDTDPVALTRYLLSYDPPGIDFLLPLDNHDRRPPGKEADLRATPYGDWLIASFDHWLRQPTTTRIRFFNSLIGLIFGAPSGVEALGLDPVTLIVVETNGDIEAVDSLKSAFQGATRLGYDVFHHDFDTVAADMAVRSRQLGTEALCEECRVCPVVRVCGGGYLPHRYSARRGFDNPSVYSSDLEKVIRHIHATLSRELAPQLGMTA
ncbi:MAG TPA: FxsB family cyclophane-forming radical SAM/SPASM peptide maturase [Methylomirabilota bacterium]|nr:FxsB family cyclophane-forming radical SAM/SPASM peptide maturase [Methylomirabilota bacterium]